MRWGSKGVTRRGVSGSLVARCVNATATAAQLKLAATDAKTLGGTIKRFAPSLTVKSGAGARAGSKLPARLPRQQSAPRARDDRGVVARRSRRRLRVRWRQTLRHGPRARRHRGRGPCRQCRRRTFFRARARPPAWPSPEKSPETPEIIRRPRGRIYRRLIQ